MDFIEMTATSFLREAFRAERVGIWHVDLAGAGSYCLADAPASPQAFHHYAIAHPIVERFRRTGSLVPLSGAYSSDNAGADSDLGTGGSISAGHGILAIPLAVGEQHVRIVAISRAVPAFSASELLLAAHLQPVLAGIWPVRRPAAPGEAEGAAESREEGASAR